MQRLCRGGGCNGKASGGGRFVGRVKFLDPESQWGFVDGASVSDIVLKVAFIGERSIQEAGLSLQDHITFTLGFTKRGDPQAEEVKITTGQNQGDFKINLMSENQFLQNGRRLIRDGLVVLPRFFSTEIATQALDRLRAECRFVSRVGHSHEGAWNPDCRIVHYIRSKVEARLNIIVANVVVSYYADGACWKPFHQDRFRNDEEVAIVCSFGGRGCHRSVFQAHPILHSF